MISDEEFLLAYNDPTKTNREVVDALRADGWVPIGVKLRSERLNLQLTVKRTGALSRQEHHPMVGSQITSEGQAWLDAHPTYRVSTATTTAAATTPATTTTASPVTNNDGDDDGDGDGDADAAADVGNAAPASGTDPGIPTKGEADTATAIVPDADEWAFQATILDQTFRFAGPTRDDAFHAFFTMLQSKNFSKVMITDSRGNPVGLNDMMNGGVYKVGRQLTAAS
jgi:hypothetical protein